jgi:hypothetical protein
MKLIKVLSLFGAAIVPHLVFAQTTMPSGLGQTKAIYDFCSQIDPADAATFSQMWIYSTDGTAALTPASGFQAKYDATMSQLKALPRLSMVNGCHGGAVQWSTPPASDKRHHGDQ